MSALETLYDILKKQLALNLKENRHAIRELMFRRTASEIVKSGFTTGCNDEAIVFADLSRKAELKITLVEGIDKRWLDAPMSEEMMRGHAFAFVDLEDNERVLVDPQRKAIYIDGSWILSMYEILGECNNFSDIGLTDFNKMQELYMKVKTAYHDKQRAKA